MTPVASRTRSLETGGGPAHRGPTAYRSATEQFRRRRPRNEPKPAINIGGMSSSGDGMVPGRIDVGKGAGFQIQNNSRQTIKVVHSGINCMYDNGDENSNFGPIAGSVPPGGRLPASGMQYIEAKGSGG